MPARSSPNPPSSTPSPPQPPRAVRVGRGKVAALVAAGLILAAMLLAVVFNIDRGEPQGGTLAPGEIDEGATPGGLTPQDLAAAATEISPNPQLIGAERGWIETVDGKQYRFSSLEPLPNGWSRMSKPQIHAILSDNRVLTMQSETAMIHMPANSPQSGTMSGDVVIRVYAVESAAAFDPAAQPPSLEVRTEQASFDNIQGEVRCEGAVDIQSPGAHLPGSGLRVQINEVDSRAQWLQMERVGAIRLASAREAAGSPVQPQPPAARQPKRAKVDKPDRPAATKPAEVQVEAPFYRLTFHQNVNIIQSQSGGWTASGDELHVIFSLEGSALDQTLTAPTRRSHALPGASPPFASTRSMLASLAIAAVQDESPQGLFQPRDDDIVITCDGGLSLTPLAETAQEPDSVDDARFELVGTPLRLRNQAEHIDIRCAALWYQSLSQRLELVGDADYPLAIDSPELAASASRFWFDRMRIEGGFTGAGSMTTPQGAAAGPAPSQDAQDLRIEWRDGVDLAFERLDAALSPTQQPDASMRLRSADFRGDVHVGTADLAMRADAMTAHFPPADHDQAGPAREVGGRTIESVLATGGVHVESLADAGSIACNELNATFRRNTAGRTVPLHMSAAGEVAAIDPGNQTVWSDVMEVAFKSDDSVATQEGSGSWRGAAVETLTARHNVQVLMADGARVFADGLEARASEEVVVLTGDDLMVISDRSAAHRGTRLELQQTGEQALWSGPGEFRYYAASIADASPQRIARPVLDQIEPANNALQMQAHWRDSMTYDGLFNERAGAVTLKGAVRAESSPDPLERSTLEAGSLTLQFIHDSSDGAPSRSIGSSSRQLKLLIAEAAAGSHAKLESHSWLRADRGDTSRVFYIAGPLITYDDQTLEAHVKGAGQLLVRDERVEAGAQPVNGSTPFSGKGSTVFNWSERLEMTRAAGTLYDIHMAGGIRVLHSALDQSRSSITADVLHAVVERGGGDARPARQGGNAFDLGGTMRVQRIDGQGGVYIDSPSRDIDCEQFQIDYATGVATLSGAGNRVVIVTSEGEPHPLRARTVIWNMAEDKITAEGVAR